MRNYGIRVSTYSHITQETTVCSSKEQALQFASGLDFHFFQAYRLWMEYPSREKDEKPQDWYIVFADPHGVGPDRLPPGPTGLSWRSRRGVEDGRHSAARDAREAGDRISRTIRTPQFAFRRRDCGSLWRRGAEIRR